MTSHRLAAVGAGLALALAAPSPALPGEGTVTKVLVRAISRDAKVIGDNVGGARITIRDAETGVLLKEGIQTGGTGDTARIMTEPHRRGAEVYGTEGAASFLAVLLLERPTRVEIAAEGPLAYPQSLQRASKTLLLVPGRDILGEGVLLEIHGYALEILAPEAGAEVAPEEGIEVRATVRMT